MRTSVRMLTLSVPRISYVAQIFVSLDVDVLVKVVRFFLFSF